MNLTARRTSGRPSKLTPALLQALVEKLEAGHFVETACDMIGLGKSTFYAWMQRGMEGRSRQFREFSDAIKRAQAASEARDLAVIDAAAQSGVWQAAAWKLERKHPRKWGLQVRHAVVQELDLGIDRLQSEFGDEPALLERALSAIAGESGASHGQAGTGTNEETASMASQARERGAA